MSPAAYQTAETPVGKELQIRARRTIHLGPLRVDIRSNEANFPGFRYFPERVAPRDTQPDSEGAPHFTLSLCNLSMDAPWPLHDLAQAQDRNYRAKRFSAGYYITDHFGKPAYLLTRGAHYWIFSYDLEPILWPYAVKLLLTLYSMHHELLHLKAAAVAIDGEATLLVARGGGGKTVLLTQLCRKGAQFLSNTHTLIGEREVVGIATAMRIRPDSYFGPIISARGLSPGFKAGEYIVDPLADLGWQSTTTARLKNICLVDYRGPEHHLIRPIDSQSLYDYMDQFSLPLNVYGLKEDVLDHLSANVGDFSVHTGRMRSRLRSLLHQCRLFHLSCDAENPDDITAIYDLLRTASPQLSTT